MRFSSREACLKTTLTLWIFLIWTSWKWWIWIVAAQVAAHFSFLFSFSPPLFCFWHSSRDTGRTNGGGNEVIVVMDVTKSRGLQCLLSVLYFPSRWTSCVCYMNNALLSTWNSTMVTLTKWQFEGKLPSLICISTVQPSFNAHLITLEAWGINHVLMARWWDYPTDTNIQNYLEVYWWQISAHCPNGEITSSTTTGYKLNLVKYLKSNLRITGNGSLRGLEK